MASWTNGSALLLILVTLTVTLSPVALANRTNGGKSFEFKIAASQTNVSLVQGATVSIGVGVLLIRGIPDNVELSLFGVPSGADAKLDPPSGIPSYSSTLTIDAGPATPTGIFSITILGLSSAGLVRKASLFLHIDSAVHDVAVTGLNSPTAAAVGDLLKYDATVSNYGSLPETVDVQLYVNDTIAAESRGVTIPPHSQDAVVLEWDTTKYSPGTYKVSLHVPPVEGEKNLENNIFNSGSIELSARTSPTPTHAAPLISVLPRDLVIVAAIAEAAVALFLFMRRRNPPD